MYQYSNNQYHLCNYRSNRSNSYRTSGRSNRYLGSKCCNNQRYSDSQQEPFTYTVTLTGGCGVITTTGTITVTPNNTVTQNISSRNRCTDSMYQYSNNQYHLCNYRSNRSNSYRTSGRSNRHLGSKCCNNQRYSDSQPEQHLPIQSP